MNVAIVGDVICFDCAVKSPQLREGYWTSDPSEVLFIDSVTGLGVATAPGKARIEYLITGVGAVTSIDVDIRGVNRVKLFRPLFQQQLIVGLTEHFNLFCITIYNFTLDCFSNWSPSGVYYQRG